MRGMKGKRTSGSTRPDYHHGDLRNALIAEAAKLTKERCQPAFTIRELATRLRVSHAAAYRHFSNKREILADVARNGFEMLRRKLVEVETKHAGNPRKRLHEQGLAYVLFAVHNEGFFRAMFHPELNDKSDLPELRDTAWSAFRCLMDTIRACQSAGLCRPAPAEQIALTAWASVHGVSCLLIDRQLESSSGLPRITAHGAASALTEMLDTGFFQPKPQEVSRPSSKGETK